MNQISSDNHHSPQSAPHSDQANFSSPKAKLKRLLSQFNRQYHLSKIFTISFIIAGIAVASVVITDNLDNRSQASISDVDVSLVPSDTTLAPGQQMTWNAFINTQQRAVTGMQLEINFNSKVFDFVSIEPGNTLTEVLVPGYASGNRAYITLGVKPTGTSPNFSLTPFQGSGVLAKLTLKPKADIATATQSTLTIVKSQTVGAGTIALAKDAPTQNVLGDAINGNVTIAPPPTPTPLPTTNPTPITNPTTAPTFAPDPPSSGLDQVTILEARVKRAFFRKRFVQIEVIAVSSAQPNTRLYIEEFGRMGYRRSQSHYTKHIWLPARDIPDSVVVISTQGGRDEAPINQNF